MKQELKENGGLPAHILWTLAIVAGVSVANIYYNQPLLNLIRQDLNVSEFQTNLIAMITQVGYALGLLFIIPLGDLYPRKKIILTNFALLVCSLLTMAVATDIRIIWAASLLTGVGSMIPQIFVPIASVFSRPENKGRNVGIVISGLLTGILASRVVSGYVGELLGWREMYFIAAGMMVVCAGVVLKVLPDIRPTFSGRYADLMKSLFRLVRDYPELRIYSIRSALAFGSMLGHVVVPGLQDGRRTVLCRQRRHRFPGPVRRGRRADRLVRRQLGEEGGCAQLQLHRVRAHPPVLVLLLLRAEQLRRHRGRHPADRHRHAVHPAQQPDKHLPPLPLSLQPSEHHLYDHLLHRRLAGHLPGWQLLGAVGLGRRIGCRLVADADITGHHRLHAKVKRQFAPPETITVQAGQTNRLG